MLNENLLRHEVEAKIQNGTSLIYFFSNNCGPCVITDKILSELSLLRNVPVYKVDINEEQDWATELKINSVPMVFLIKDGQFINKVIGLTESNKYYDLIEKFI